MSNNEKNTAQGVNVAEIKKQYKKKSQLADIFHRLKRNKTAMLGFIVFALIVIVTIGAQFYFDYDVDVTGQNIPNRLQWPSLEHPFGTDENGRDMFARVLYGAFTSLGIAFATVTFALIVGGTLGSISGFFGGKLDNIIMRIMDVFLAIPGTLFAIVLVAVLGQNIINLIIALAISSVPGISRIVRSSVITVRDVEYIEAARAIGAKNSRIILVHVIPNSLAPVIVQATLNVASAILTITGLSFLGLGVKPPAPEWGNLLSAGRNFIADSSYLTLFPGLAIMVTILSLNLLGDGLRDALDPRLK